MEVQQFLSDKIAKLRSDIYSIFYTIYYGNKNTDYDNEIIISLTTYPTRYKYVHKTIESLLEQTHKPDKIILWLSKAECTTIPPKLLELQKRGLTIKYTNADIKSYLKLIPALKLYPESTIITVDDDVLYPKYFVQKIINAHSENPDCIIAYNCRKLKKINNYTLSPYTDFGFFSSTNPSYNTMPIGNMGVLYPPGSLHSEVFNQDVFLSLSPYADDIWFKSMALLNGTKTRTVFDSRVLFSNTQNKKINPLFTTNFEENDKKIKKVFDYYDLYKYIDG